MLRTASPTGLGRVADTVADHELLISAAPLDPRHAQQGLNAADDRDVILVTLLRAMRARATHAALFTVHGPCVRLRFAIHDDAAIDRRSAPPRLSLEVESALRTAVRARAPVAGPLTGDDADFDAALGAMLPGAGDQAVVVPVVLGERTVALVCGHHDGAPIGLADVADVLPVADAAAEALSRIIVSAKRAASGRGRTIIGIGLGDVAAASSAVPGGDLRAALRAAEAWIELAELLESLIEATEPSELRQLRALLVELGELEERMLARPERAIEAWRRVLDGDPTDREAIGALKRLYADQARWRDCVAILELEAGLAGEAERLELLAEAAHLLESRAEDVRGAITLYQSIRASQPDHALAGDRLVELLTAVGDWQALIEVLLERADHCDYPPDRAATLARIAALYEQELGDPGAALLVWQTALCEDPADHRAVDQVERLAATQGAWDELAAALEGRATRLEEVDPDAACEAWLSLARVERERAGRPDEAAVALERALALVRDHDAALAQLVELHGVRGDVPAQIAALRRRAEVAATDDERVEHLLAAADLQENALDDPGAATAAYRAVLELDPGCLLALVSLERLCRARADWPALAAVLARIAERRADDPSPDERLRVLLELAELSREQLGDADAAIVAYQQVLSIDAANLQALAALEALHEERGDIEEYLDTLEKKLDSGESAGGERVHLYERLASVWEKELDAPARAAACLEKLTDLEPDSPGRHQQLIRAYRASGDSRGLVNAYRRYLAHTEEPLARIDILVAMAEVLEDQNGDPAGAAASYREVLTLDPGEPRALRGLARLVEDRDPARAMDCLERLLEASIAADEGAELATRIGRLAHAVGDRARAEAHLFRALELVDDHLPALRELAVVQAESGDFRRAAETMRRAAAVTTDTAEEARLRESAAGLLLEHLDRPEEARVELEAVVALQPRNRTAQVALARLHARDADWSAAAPLLTELVAALTGDAWSREERVSLWSLAARCAEELGDREAALARYREVLALEPRDPEAHLRRAALLVALERWDDAASALRSILTQGLVEGEALARVCYQLGVVHQRRGELNSAVDLLERSLSIRPDRAVFDILLEVHRARGDHAAVVATLRERVPVAVDDGERAALHAAIGDAYRDHLANVPKAVAAYREALAVTPGNHQILQRLLDLHSDEGRWKNAVEIIDEFLAIEDEPLRRARYFAAAGAICREKLKDEARALELYDDALVSFFAVPDKLDDGALTRALGVFREIDEMLTGRRDWKAQERAYRRMIERIPRGRVALAARLWQALGEICRARTKEPEAALRAFGVAHELEPTGERAELVVAACLAAPPALFAVAAEQLERLIASEPRRAAGYRALFELYHRAGEIDRAWCVAQALLVLDAASPEIRAWAERYPVRDAASAARRVTSELWGKLRHPDEDPRVGAVLAAAWEAVALATAQSHKAYGLRRRDACDLDEDERRELRLVAVLCDFLGVARPQVFAQAEPGGLLVANCCDRERLTPALVVRQDLGRRSAGEAAFVAAKLVAMLRAERFARLALPSSAELKPAVLGVFLAVEPGFPVPDELRPAAAAHATRIRERMSSSALEHLAQLASVCIREGARLDVSQWKRGTEATARRAALLACGDLRSAALALADEAGELAGPSAQARLDDLLVFAVSERYFAARRAVGLAHD